MPNHWHLAVFPCAEGDLAKFLQGIALTYTQHYQASPRHFIIMILASLALPMYRLTRSPW